MWSDVGIKFVTKDSSAFVLSRRVCLRPSLLLGMNEPSPTLALTPSAPTLPHTHCLLTLVLVREGSTGPMKRRGHISAHAAGVVI